MEYSKKAEGQLKVATEALLVHKATVNRARKKVRLSLRFLSLS